MQLGIWHLSKKRVDGNTVRNQPCGGTETAVVYTAEALARRGIDVTVFCNCETARELAGVRYQPVETFPASAWSMVFDAFVVVRHLATFGTPVSTRALFYWTHDNLDQPFLHGMLRAFEPESKKMVACLHLGELMGSIDGVFVVSQWQRTAIAERLGVDGRRIHVIGNGLPPGVFNRFVDVEQRNPVVIYSLPPDRGFLPLLKIFSRVRTAVPDAELHLFSRSTIYGDSEDEDEARYGQLYAAARRMPGVRHFDPVGQQTLARAMTQAKVYAYPTVVEETFCISLLEAQAAGLVPVASERGAIPERIRSGVDGFLIPGNPHELSCERRFADRVQRVLQDEKLRRTIAHEALNRAHSHEYGYDAVAGRMIAAIEPFLETNVRHRHVDVSAWPTPYRTPTTHPNAALPREVSNAELGALESRFRELLRLGQYP